MLGHYHIQTTVDPGPAFQWDYVVHNAREYSIGRNLRQWGLDSYGSASHGIETFARNQPVEDSMKQKNKIAGCPR